MTQTHTVFKQTAVARQIHNEMWRTYIDMPLDNICGRTVLKKRGQDWYIWEDHIRHEIMLVLRNRHIDKD